MAKSERFRFDVRAKDTGPDLVSSPVSMTMEDVREKIGKCRAVVAAWCAAGNVP